MQGRGGGTRAKDPGWLRNQHPTNAEGITSPINDRGKLLVKRAEICCAYCCDETRDVRGDQPGKFRRP